VGAEARARTDVPLLAQVQERSALAEFWRRYRRNAGALFGLGVIALLFATAVLAPVLATHDPTLITRSAFDPPSPAHFLGSDDLGRDLYSTIVYGARITLLVGFLSAFVSTLIGTAVGAAAGYFRGVIDDALMRVTELFLVTPRFFLVLVAVAILGPSIWNVIVVISLLSWPATARLVRGQFLTLRERDFVEAARASGVQDPRIIVRHILPNALPPIVVAGSLQVGQAILIEAGISFLGLGDPQAQSWGRMLNNAQQFLGRSLWMAFFPGAAIFLSVLGLNLVGDGVNDALDARATDR
jgi:peptide/nickel transport system permease protein